MNFKNLSAPFHPNDIEWRISRCGVGAGGKVWARCLAYVNARAVMARLDEVCGPGGWQVSYNVVPGAGMIARLSIKVGDEWVTKEDGADPTDIEAFKGGLSSALKRAGAAWGIGRYLYLLEEDFAVIVNQNDDGARWGQTKDKKDFYWLPPALPAWAMPEDCAPAPKTVAPKSAAQGPAPLARPAVIPAASPTPKALSRMELGHEISKAADKLGLSTTGMGEWIQDRYQKPMSRLNPSEMEDFLGALGAELLAKERV